MKNSLINLFIAIIGLTGFALMVSTIYFFYMESLFFIVAMFGGAGLFVWSSELDRKQIEKREKQRVHNLKNKFYKKNEFIS